MITERLNHKLSFVSGGGLLLEVTVSEDVEDTFESIAPGFGAVDASTPSVESILR